MKTNEEILESRMAAFNQRPEPRVGDFLKLPYGLFTRFTHAWTESDKMQTGGSVFGQYYLGDGYQSYSGGLDSGVKISDLVLTDETKEGNVWFFDNNIAGAGRGRNFMVPLRVYELKEGADTTGCPEITKHEEAEFLKLVETTIRINGNGQEYIQHVAKVRLEGLAYDKDKIEQAERLTGLTFKGGVVQPLKFSQLETIKEVFVGFKQTHYDNWTFKNTLVISR